MLLYPVSVHHPCRRLRPLLKGDFATITRETLSELLDVLNVQASHPQTPEQRTYVDGLKNMLEMVLTDYYRKPGVVIAFPIDGVTKYVFIDERGNVCS